MTVQVTIIGLGQIGSSIGLALAKHSELVTRVGHDKDIGQANRAKQMGALDRVDINIPHSVEEAGLVILALPLDQVRETLTAMAQELKEDVVVMDMSPVKQVTLEWAKELLPPKRHFIGMTPALNPDHLPSLEGGIGAAHADLFQNGLFAIVSPPGVPSEAIKLAADFSRLLGAEHLFVDPMEVDSLMASTHLLPQLVATTLVNLTVDQPGWLEARKLAGRAYVAAASQAAELDEPAALAAAAANNRENVTRVLDNLIFALQQLRSQVHAQDEVALRQQAERARDGYLRWWKQRSSANWMVAANAPAVELPTAKDVFGRMFGLRKRKSDQNPS